MKILYVHGVNVHEDCNLYTDWNDAITIALKKYGYTKQVIRIPAFYNNLFDHAPLNFFTYIEAVMELLGSLIDSEALKRLRKVPKGQQPQPPNSQTIPDFIRWAVGMVAQFVVEKKLRKNCRDYLWDTIQKNKPDVICAHSLGSMLCYDLAINDSRGDAAFAGRTFITFGSQINNTFVCDRLWNRRIEMVSADFWHHLFNPNDPVFTADIKLPNVANFHSRKIDFGKPFFDPSAHEPVLQKTDAQPHTGYLDDSRTADWVWKTLAKKFGTIQLNKPHKKSSVYHRKSRYQKSTRKNS